MMTTARWPRIGRIWLGAFFAALMVMTAAPPASAASFMQSFTVRPKYDVYSIIMYQKTASGGGTTNSFRADAPSTVITDPFPKFEPITGAFLLGVSSFGNSESGPTEHLILALNGSYANGLLNSHMDFSELFAGYDEASLIAAANLLDTMDLAEDDPGRAAQFDAKEAASQLVFNFSDTIVANGGLFNANGAFKMVAFSEATDGGEGESAVTVTASVPEPATWGLMILGFGGVGAVIRRRRAQPLAAA